LQRNHQQLEPRLRQVLERVLAGGRYVLGPELDAFEAEFAAYVGARHCVGVGSGLDALRLTLAALDIGAGDEVLVPANTYIATWMAVHQVGAVPVPVEPDPCGWNMDPRRLEEAITTRTRAVLPVHLYGQPADMDGITGIARRHGLLVVDDAAQAHGARSQGRRVGAIGHATAWSFYPTKNLGALGDGGAVTTDDEGVAGRLRRLRFYGFDGPDDHLECGWNSRLDELQAAVLRTKLEVLDEWNSRRRIVAGAYLSALADASLTLPTVGAGDEAVWHLFVVRSPRRDELRRALQRAGIETGIHYRRPPHLQPSFAHLERGEGSFPLAEAHHREVVSLPIGAYLTEEEIVAVGAAVARAAEHLDG
jgi:dTDP-4-amino-4,6-dideoxygalactose transaminase